jgi:hypothetical protein
VQPQKRRDVRPLPPSVHNLVNEAFFQQKLRKLEARR